VLFRPEQACQRKRGKRTGEGNGRSDPVTHELSPEKFLKLRAANQFVGGPGQDLQAREGLLALRGREAVEESADKLGFEHLGLALDAFASGGEMYKRAAAADRVPFAAVERKKHSPGHDDQVAGDFENAASLLGIEVVQDTGLVRV
jgi:hypothetical protein